MCNLAHVRGFLHRMWDRLTGKDRIRECNLAQLDEKIANLRQVKHDIANRTDVILWEAYMGRMKRQQRGETDVGHNRSPNRS